MSSFLEILDGMIETTEEFIGDDGLRADDSRIHDLSAFIRTREEFVDTYASMEGSRLETTYEVLREIWAHVVGKYDEDHEIAQALPLAGAFVKCTADEEGEEWAKPSSTS